ncbi:HTH_Tnp_Tc3_2 domain-containing protein [Trichonephila clavipes]|nr:HTH_Tnp_Tc3_2 domain-containing protein [Trichonephila clavipes]
MTLQCKSRFFDKSVDPETVRNVLRKHKYHGRVPEKKPYISNANRQASLAFAKMYVRQPTEYWENITFVDETLVDGVTRYALFNVWKEEQDLKRKIEAVLSLVRSTTDFDKHENQQQLKFRKIVKNFCSFVGKKWMRCHRNEKFFSKSNDA